VQGLHQSPWGIALSKTPRFHEAFLQELKKSGLWLDQEMLSVILELIN
jgi:hypothetical protein